MNAHRKTRRPLIALLALLSLAGSALPLFAASPREELLRLVPDDVGFCLIVQDLRKHSAQFLASPFYEQLGRTSLVKELSGGPELRQLAGINEILRKQLGVQSAQLRDDIFGDAVVLAYRPSPDDKPEHEQGVLLLRAREAKFLADLIERLNTVQKETGELKSLETRKHADATYHVRVEGKGRHFYYLNGAVLAFSSQEEIIKQVIECDKRPAKIPLIEERLQRLKIQDGLATLWINPRAFDAGLARKLAKAEAKDAPTLRQMELYWKALDGVAVTASLRKADLELGLSFLARAGKMPEAASKFFTIDNRVSGLWNRFPDNALLTIAGRIDVPALTEFFAAFVSPADRQKLRQSADMLGAATDLDVVRDILPNLGPDWGLCVLPPPKEAKYLTPAALFALRVSAGSKEKPVDKSLLEGLNSAAAWIVLGASRGDLLISLKKTTQDKIEVRSLHSDKGQANGVEPSYALKDGYLLLGTTPAALRHLGKARPSEASGEECPLLRCSLKELGNFLSVRRDLLVADIAARNQLQPEEARKRLQRMEEICQLFNRLELTRRVGTGQVSLLLRLHTEQPLRK